MTAVYRPTSFRLPERTLARIGRAAAVEGLRVPDFVRRTLDRETEAIINRAQGVDHAEEK